MKKILFLVLFLGACSHGVVNHEAIVRVPVPVAQPCVNGARPEVPITLNKKYTIDQWNALDVKQKTAAVARQGLNYKTYGEQLNSVTSACP